MKPAEKVESLKKHLSKLEFMVSQTATQSKQQWYELEIKRTKNKISELSVK